MLEVQEEEEGGSGVGGNGGVLNPGNMMGRGNMAMNGGQGGAGGATGGMLGGGNMNYNSNQMSGMGPVMTDNALYNRGGMSGGTNPNMMFNRGGAGGGGSGGGAGTPGTNGGPGDMTKRNKMPPAATATTGSLRGNQDSTDDVFLPENNQGNVYKMMNNGGPSRGPQGNNRPDDTGSLNPSPDTNEKDGDNKEDNNLLQDLLKEKEGMLCHEAEIPFCNYSVTTSGQKILDPIKCLAT